MAEAPAVSIGLPVFNGERFLEGSARALLGQTFTDIELIICDNASTDGTADICSQLADEDRRVRVVRHETNIGAAANFNSAFTAARGRYFKWAADDDHHEPTYVEACVSALEGRPEAPLAYCRAQSIDATGRILRPDWGDRSDLASDQIEVRLAAALARPRDPIPLPMFAVMRRDVLAATGLLQPMPEFDRALIAELALHGPFIEVPKVLFGHREHGDRMGPVLASDSRAAARLLGRQSLLPHWTLVRRHLASISRRPPGSPAAALVLEVVRWAWQWRVELLHDVRSAVTAPLTVVPGVSNRLEQRRRDGEMARHQARQASLVSTVENLTGAGDRVILVDGDSLTVEQLNGTDVAPLAPMDSPDGAFPATGTGAIARLDRRHAQGFTHLAVAWPATWVLDYYVDFADHLHSHHELVAATDDVVLFRLR